MVDFSKQRLLVIAPHPDDEVIGCGGLIRKIKDDGGSVYVLFLTVGDTHDFSKKGLSTASERKREVEKVAKYFKFNGFHIAFPGNKHHLQLDLLGQKTIMHAIERESPVSIERVKPTIVAFPSIISYNQDHRITAAAAHAALRLSSPVTKHFVETVLSYESPADGWSLQNRSEVNCFVSLTKMQLSAKLEALKLYRSQLRPSPSSRAIDTLKSLSMLLGVQCGSAFAEGFILHRAIV